MPVTTLDLAPHGTTGESEPRRGMGEDFSKSDAEKLIDQTLGINPEAGDEDDERDNDASELETDPRPARRPAAKQTVEDDDDPGVDEVEIPAALVNRAIRAGLDYEDVQSMTDPVALERIIQRLEVVQNQQRPNQGQQAQGGAGAQQQQQLQAAAKRFELKLPEPLTLEHADELQVARDQLYRDAIAGMHQQVTALLDWQNQLSDYQLHQVKQEAMGWFDKQIEGLGDEFSARLGKGDHLALTKANQEEFLSARDALWARTAALVGHGIPRDEAFASALAGLYRKQVEERGAQRVRDEVKGRTRRRVGSGTRRAGSLDERDPPPPADKTKDPVLHRKFKQMLEEQGTR